MLKPMDVIASLERRPAGTGWILAGEEDFLREEVERAVVKAVLGEEPTAGGMVVIDALREGGSKIQLADILDELRTPSLFCERKVVSVRRAGALVRTYAEELEKHLCGKATPGVLLLHAEDWDKRAAYAKRLDRFTVDCSPLYETAFGDTSISASSQLGRWVRERARRAGLRISDEAIVRLIELIGADLAGLSDAIEKLSLLQRQSVSVEDVDTIVAPSRSFSQFKVAELVLTSKTAECLAAVEACFEQGIDKGGGRVERSESGVAELIVWAISRELERMYIARGLLEEDKLDVRSAGALGVPPFMFEKFAKRVSQTDAEHLGRALADTLEAASSLRGGTPPRAVVESLVLRLCAMPAQKAV